MIPNHQPALYIDDRWRGKHGIGRFATEVVRRLTMSWVPLGGRLAPTSPVDIFNLRRLGLKREDLVYSPGFNAGITCARQLLNIHDLIHLQIDSEKSFAKSLYYNTVVRWAVRRAGIVMTDSVASAKAIRDWVRAPRVEIVVVGCGKSEAFVPEGESVVFDRPTFVYVGNLKPHKNFDVLLEMIALRPQFDLIVVSSDAELARAYVAARGIERQVTVRTGVPDLELAAIYRGATGSLQPSILEGFGLPSLEAMSCGTRVAYWRGCESVAEICSGAGVEVRNAESATEWAQALDNLEVSAKGGSLHMSAEWHDRYTWSAVAARVDAVIRQQL